MINNVVLMGRLTADPELRTTTTGRSVCSFSIAVQRSYARNGEERATDFINIVAWENTANFVSRYFRKGSMIALQGQIQTRQYEDKTGAKRTAFEVIARDVSFCGSKAESGTTGGGYAPTVAPAQAPAYQSAAPSDFEEITDDEDLPF
ncbi:MAG: single-stranded DNA-binding protein [Ruminococcus sp.]|nr:single-stranded DNA-binding protein [Ruminococcus sp.]